MKDSSNLEGNEAPPNRPKFMKNTEILYHEAVFGLFQASAKTIWNDTSNLEQGNHVSNNRALVLDSARSVLSLFSSFNSVDIFQCQ